MMLRRDSFWTALFALDRLNSWVRSDRPYFCHGRSALKPVIYWTKTQAILDASKREWIEMKRVKVEKPCETCDHTGSWVSDQTWWHYDWDEHITKEEVRANYGERCRACGGTGTRVLRFVETQIGPIRWHTPDDRWHSSSLDVYVPFPTFYGDKASDVLYEPAKDWQPRTPGRPMRSEEVLRDMLILLDAYPHEVGFSIDFHHRIRCQKMWRYTDKDIAAKWLAERTEMMRIHELIA